MSSDFDRWMDKMDGQMKEGLSMLDNMREQMRLKAKLGEMEMREEMAEFEKKWDTWRGKMSAAGEEMKDSSENIGKAFDGLMHEMKETFDRVHKKMKDD